MDCDTPHFDDDVIDIAVSTSKMMILLYFDYCDINYHETNYIDLNKLQRLLKNQDYTDYIALMRY